MVAMPSGIATFLRSCMQTGKDTRVFVGIIIVCDDHKYCIPLSSPKKKHKKMRNSMDFSKIEVEGEPFTFSCMCPCRKSGGLRRFDNHFGFEYNLTKS